MDYSLISVSSEDSDNSHISSPSERVEELSLSAEQRHALESAKNGKSIFITGSAGVGKSFLLKEIMKVLPRRSTYITASTGVAACNIGGTTLHSFAGVGLAQKPAVVLAQGLFSKYKTEVRRRWHQCCVLVIDEISMIDGELFEKVEEVARIIRGDPRPFGGIQVVLCGDFLQLPPVKSQYFAFETKAWSNVVEETVVLKKVFRQKEVGFVKLLNRLRTGTFTQLDVNVLNSCRHTTFADDGIKATRLFPKRFSCEELNYNELRNLHGQSEKYKAVDSAVTTQYQEMLDKNSRLAKELELKCGAQVILLVNKDVNRQLVNGSRGVVVGFRDKAKSLGQNLHDALELREGNNFLGSISEKDLLENAVVRCNDDDDDEENRKCFGGTKNPIVLFASGVVDVIDYEQQSITVGNTNVASRTQIPLMLAWAVSIHKSQGMTLDRIDVSLADAFEHGQSYVALSRVTSLDGLLLRNFKQYKITAHPKVLTYYQKVDPDFDKFTAEGDEDLQLFIEIKKRSGGYAKILKDIKDRNDSGASCSYSVDTCGASSACDVKVNSPGTGEPGEQPFHKPSADGSKKSTTSKALLKAQSALQKCKQALEEAKSEPIYFIPNENNFDEAGACCSKSVQQFAETMDDYDQHKNDKVDITVFDADDFDKSLIGESSSHVSKDPKEAAGMSTKSFAHRSNCQPSKNFLDIICPDLLESDNSFMEKVDDVRASSKKPLETVMEEIDDVSTSSMKTSEPVTEEVDDVNVSSKRPLKSVKRKRLEQSDEVPTPKRIVECDEDHIKTLLKEKADLIESKRKAALERRRQSLQRSNK